jgi:hypothetical protein
MLTSGHVVLSMVTVELDLTFVELETVSQGTVTPMMEDLPSTVNVGRSLQEIRLAQAPNSAVVAVQVDIVAAQQTAVKVRTAILERVSGTENCERSVMSRLTYDLLKSRIGVVKLLQRSSNQSWSVGRNNVLQKPV